MMKPLVEDWGFLIGEWRGQVKEMAVEEGNIRSKAIFSYAPGPAIIQGIGEAYNEKGLVNSSYSYLLSDGEKFIRKAIFSYGFVNNEISYSFNESEIRFDVVVEPNPPNFAGITWRSFVRKLSEDKVTMGLENSRDGGPFSIFNETVYIRQ